VSNTGAGDRNKVTLTLPQALALAEQHMQAGRLAQAEQLCKDILRAHPNHAGALHLWGIVAYQAQPAGGV